MSSPTPEIFLVLSSTTGAPLTGGAGGMSFEFYGKETGATLTPPTISEIGGGLYSFTPTFADTTHGIVYVVATGGNPAYVYRYMRPEDYNTDLVSTLYAIGVGKWEVVTSGVDANSLILYDLDGVTVVKKFNLLDSSGSPTSLNPFSRIPV